MKNQTGFILMESLLACLLASLVVLSVIAIYLPLRQLALQQQVWLTLQHRATFVTALLINRITHSKTIQCAPNVIILDQCQLQVRKTQRMDSEGRAISALYIKENGQRSEEWMEGVENLTATFDAVRGVKVSVSFLAPNHLQDQWSLYIAR